MPSCLLFGSMVVVLDSKARDTLRQTKFPKQSLPNFISETFDDTLQQTKFAKQSLP